MKRKAILFLIFALLALTSSGQSLENPLLQKPNSLGLGSIDDLDLCATRYMEGIQTKSFYEGKEEARAGQINDLKLENLILKSLLVYLVVR